MNKSNFISSFILLILLNVTLLVVSSCSQNRKQPAIAKKTNETIVLAQVTMLAGLPDSNKPGIKFLENLPKPYTILNPKLPVVQSFTHPVTKDLIPPEAQGMGFFTNFSTDQGLLQETVNATVMDRKGNLWFGTGAGVSRYDGKKFTNYTTAQGLTSNSVKAIIEDKIGNLWFGTLGGGVNCFDGKKITRYTTAHGLCGNIVWSIMQDRTGDIWFGTVDGGVSRLNGNKFTNYTTKDGLAGNEVQSIKEDKTGNIWFGTKSGVSRYDGKYFINYTVKEGLPGNVVNCISEDKAGNIWFGTNGSGVSRYDGKIFTNYSIAQGLAGNIVNCISEDKAGNIWFGTGEGGVSCYDGKKFINFNTTQGLANNLVWNITEDKTGNLWFGTGGGGISRYDGKSFTCFTSVPGRVMNSVFSITKDKSGNIWFGNEGGVSSYDGTKICTYSAAQGFTDRMVYGITLDKTGILWLCTERGVIRYDGKNFTSYTAKQGLPNNIICKITEVRSGDLWIGTLGGGAICFNGKSFTTYTIAQGLANNIVRSITEDKNGVLWMATANGVSRYDGKSFANYTTSQGLAHNIILNITEDKEGNLWIGTEGGGVSRYDGKSFTSFNTTHGLPDNVVTSIVVDSSGKIIFGTNFGIGVLTSFTQTSTEKKAGNSIPAQNNLSNEELIYYTPQIEVYNSYTGYPVKDVNYGQNAMLQENNGIVWIGTGADKTGLVRFDYSAIKKRDDPPVVMLQSIRINNENITWYNLLPASRREELKPDSNSTAPHIIEELAIFGKVLNESERDSIRVKFGNIKFDSIDSFYSIPENLVLPYKHNSISFDFAAIEPARPYLLKYQYILEGYDEDWSKESNQSSATYGNLHEGSYTFKLKAKSPDRVWSVPMLYHFKVLPPWYRSWWAYIIYILVGVFFISAIIRWRTKSLKQEKIKLEEKISQRTTQLEQKSIELAKSLENLKATQTQLIQSEKMASLGELTAGIAHEIQNPLNFVNNFSEVNTELIGELKKEIEDRNYAVLKDIADDLENNMGKITEHGKRAGSIVKSMLLHSRTSSSQKEMTDINALVEEYVRLAFHGMRAKDKSFNAKLITSYDPGAGSLDLVPQDIGRVLLNLLNNAFYAVNERRKIEGNGYEPEVSVETKRSGERIQISVADNGKGVPENLLNKIFQPFFTTKPAGEGTGLGLSLSYDIVKAHGGTLKIESTEVGLTQFTIELPVWQVPAGRA